MKQPFLWFLGAFGLVASLVACNMARQAQFKAFLRVFLPIMLLTAVAWSQIPLKLVFLIYRDDLEHVAMQIESENPPKVPFRIGPHKFKSVGLRSNGTVPYLSENETGHDITGFARHPDGHGFNLWSYTQMDEKWSHVIED